MILHSRQRISFHVTQDHNSKDLDLNIQSLYLELLLMDHFDWEGSLLNITQAIQHVLLASATASIVRHSVCWPFTLLAEEPKFSPNCSTPALHTSGPTHTHTCTQKIIALQKKNASYRISRRHSPIQPGRGLISAHKTPPEIYNCLLSSPSYSGPGPYVQSSLLAFLTKEKRMPYVEVMSVCLSQNISSPIRTVGR